MQTDVATIWTISLTNFRIGSTIVPKTRAGRAVPLSQQHRVDRSGLGRLARLSCQEGQPIPYRLSHLLVRVGLGRLSHPSRPKGQRIPYRLSHLWVRVGLGRLFLPARLEGQPVRNPHSHLSVQVGLADPRRFWDRNLQKPFQTSPQRTALGQCT